MFTDTYRRMNDRIAAAPELVADTVARADGLKKKPRAGTKPLYRRPAAVAAAAVAALALATPVLAAYVPPIHELMYLVSPEIAQSFVPVQASCEDNGIRMEVVSTDIEGDTARVYITMRDLTRDRVDATTDLFDSYSLDVPFDSVSHCERVYFDADTRTATFLITISAMDGRDIKTGNGKVTFSVREFLSRKVSDENIPVPLDLASVGAAEDVFDLAQSDSYAYTGGSSIDGTSPDSYTALLLPGDPVYSLGDGFAITGIGFIDGQLHVQAAAYDKLTLDTHGDFQLKDADGNTVLYNSVCFAEGMGTDSRTDYQEFIFDVSPEKIGRYRLVGSYYSGGMNTKGNWRVTFPLAAGGEAPAPLE